MIVHGAESEVQTNIQLKVELSKIKDIMYLTRRLCALFYDLIIILGLFVLATFIAVLIHHKAFEPSHLGFQLYLLFIAMLYFAGLWAAYGQTVGMAVWKIHLVDNINYCRFLRCVLRFIIGLLSIFVLGFTLLPLSQNKKPLIDRWTGLTISS